MHVAFYRSETDTAPRTGDIGWEVLVSDLSTHSETFRENACPGHSCQLKKGEAWSPVELIGDKSRRDANVRSVSALVFDIDSAHTTAEEIANQVSECDVRFVLHSTHSHMVGATPLPSLRIVIALSRPVMAREWPEFFKRAVTHFGFDGLIDEKCKNLSRLYFFPSRCATSPAPTVITRAGPALNVDRVLSSTTAPKLPSGAPLAPPAPVSPPAAPVGVLSGSINLDVFRDWLKALRKPESKELMRKILHHEPLALTGNRDNAINQAMSVLAGFDGVTSGTLMTLVEPSLMKMEVMPEGLDFWKAKALDCFSRSRDRFQTRDALNNEIAGAIVACLPSAAAVPPEDTGPLLGGEEWHSSLMFRRAKDGSAAGLKPNEANIEAILTHDSHWQGAMRFNDVTKSIDVFDGPLNEVPLADLSFTAAVWLQKEYQLECSPAQVAPALLKVARTHHYDPLQDYLRGLVWDYVPRLDTYLSKYCGTSRHVGRIGRKWALGAVARALAPGCKMDNVLILVGDYGTRKTGFIETMAGQFYSNGRVDFSSKDSRMLAARYWIVELAEMSGYRKADNEAVKDWLSTRIDSYRPPYGSVVEDFPRRAVFVGTSNDVELLNEPNRREWVVEVTDIDIPALTAERDQIWAEAVAAHDAGEEWWFDKAGEKELNLHAAEFASPTPMRDMVLEWWLSIPKDKREKDVDTITVAQRACGYTLDKVTPVIAREVSRSLLSLGWTRLRKVLAVNDGKEVRQYCYRASRALMEIERPEK
jgi:hypothetical protein